MCSGRGHAFDKPTTVAAPPLPRDWRRRSADVGGLHLATTTAGQGQGWMGGDHAYIETIFAEQLSELYIQTNSSVNDNKLSEPPRELSNSVRSRLIHSLDRWNFLPHELPDEERLECALILFEVLFRVDGMQEAIPVSMNRISEFIHHLRRIYRLENSYHNFDHALDVLQATQSYLKSAGMVPSPLILFEPKATWRSKKPFNSPHLISCLGLRELFVLYIAAIGHDVGHPGVSNLFMKNANAPLSSVFDGTSALENLHFLLLLQLMRHHGLTALLDDPKLYLRKLLQQTVLATDMSVHKDFMDRMQRFLDGELGTLCQRQTIISQAILKNADISNPTRPFLVSKLWAGALMEEWTAQAQLEEELQLQTTVISSNDPLQMAKGQIFFISTFAKPLLELTEKAVPEISMYTIHCKLNLKTWRKKKAELESRPAPSPPPPTTASVPPTSPRQTPFQNVLPISMPESKSIPDSSVYTPSTSGRSENESAPDSPTESESVSSAMFSSVSDASSSHKALSVIAASVSSSGPTPPSVPAPHAAIRAASKVGSLRQAKEARARKTSRNSWCVTTTPNMAAIFRTPTPPPPPGGVDSPDGDTPKKGADAAPPPLQPPGGSFTIIRPLNVQP